MSLFLHFSSTYMHQVLKFYSSLYSEAFYRGVCSYVIYITFIRKSIVKMTFWLLTVFIELQSDKNRNPKSPL